jgi:hypothetical protein
MSSIPSQESQRSPYEGPFIIGGDHAAVRVSKFKAALVKSMLDRERITSEKRRNLKLWARLVTEVFAEVRYVRTKFRQSTFFQRWCFHRLTPLSYHVRRKWLLLIYQDTVAHSRCLRN